jgi:hypothetical protein
VAQRKVFIPKADLATRLPGIQSPEQVTDAQELSPMSELSDAFPVAPASLRGHLNIIPAFCWCVCVSLFVLPMFTIPIEFCASRNGSFSESYPFAALETRLSDSFPVILVINLNSIVVFCSHWQWCSHLPRAFNCTWPQRLC